MKIGECLNFATFVLVSCLFLPLVKCFLVILGDCPWGLASEINVVGMVM